MDYAAEYENGFPYQEFLSKYATDEQTRRWNDFRDSVHISDDQQALLKSFVREMKVLVLAGTWCGDCVNQCPIFEKFALCSDKLQVRYFDRDAATALAAELKTCGGARVPVVVFLSEDGQFCGRYGDRTLSKYRSMASHIQGASCPTGLAVDEDLTASVVQDWLDEFERIQWMLRTSSRLRQLHSD